MNRNYASVTLNKKVVSGSGFGLILSVGGNKNLSLRINFAQPNFVMRIRQSLITSDEILK